MFRKGNNNFKKVSKYVDLNIITISVVAAYLSEGCCVANSDVYGGAKQGCGGEKLGAA
jgi:hypothetical protein